MLGTKDAAQPLTKSSERREPNLTQLRACLYTHFKPAQPYY